MPDQCAANGCSNRRSLETRTCGITFHLFPKTGERRMQWELALRRNGFVASARTLLCSDHFRSEDFDRTGQTVRLKDCVVPTVFNFPAHLQRPEATRSPTTSIRVEDDLPMDLSPDAPQPHVMHISIREGRSLPDLQRCTTCCEVFHCPLCASDVFQPAKLSKLKIHLENHFNRAVLHEGYTIHRCALNCRPAWHFHCFYCQSMLMRRAVFIKHLALCKAKHSALTPIIPDPSTPIIPDPSTPIIPDPSTPIIPDPSTPIIPEGNMQRVRVKPVLKKKCPMCHVLLHKTQLKRHMERKHSAKQKDMTSSSHLQSECIDPANGVYAVHKAFHGTSTPLHVQNKVWGENQYVSCENNECQVNLELAWRSGIKANQCAHLKSIAYGSSYASPTELDEETLTEMVNNKWFDEDKKRLCLVRQNLAKCNHVPLSVYSIAGTPKTTKYISIYEPTVSDYSRLGRVMVSYDTNNHLWHCPCAKTNISCPHKYIAKWHLFQTHRELFRKVRSTEEVEGLSTAASTEDEHSYDEADLGDIPHPPIDVQKLKGMAQYILSHKKLPAVLPEQMHITIREGRSLPDLQRCTTCCEDFHCPFCASDVFQPAKLSKVKAHLESHFNRAVLHEGYTIHRCALNCRPDWHFHCFYCQSMLMRRADFIKHLALGKAKHSALTPIIPDPSTPIIPDPSTPMRNFNHGPQKARSHQARHSCTRYSTARS